MDWRRNLRTHHAAMLIIVTAHRMKETSFYRWRAFVKTQQQIEHAEVHYQKVIRRKLFFYWCYFIATTKKQKVPSLTHLN